MADKFTISEVYENESNRVQADESNPIKDDTLMLVSENDNGTYKTKALDYGTLQSSLCASLDIQNIINNSTTVNNYGDTLGISGDYPCFFEMYSSNHFNSVGGVEQFSQTDIDVDNGETKGLYGKAWGGNDLWNSVQADDTLDKKIQFGKQGSTIQATTSYLSSYNCLKPFKLFANEHPDPQLVTVVIVSKYSGGVYFDHKVDDDTWQRTPIFTYNPDTNSDIASFKFIAAPGSRFGIFGKGGTNEFFKAQTTIIITLTNTKGHLKTANYAMQFSGGQWTNEITFDDIKQTDRDDIKYTEGWLRVYGPVNGRLNGGTICLLMKHKNDQMWSVVSTKIYASTNARITQYVDFGRFYIEKGTMLKCWSSSSDLVLNGTSKIDGVSLINGVIYCEPVTQPIPSKDISQPLKITINPNRTLSSQHGRNIQFKLNGDNQTTKYIKIRNSGDGIYHNTGGTQDFRYYLPLVKNESMVQNSVVDISVDCSNLTKGNPLQFYVSTPTVNSYDEFRSSTSDGQYSGIQSIDGTDDRCMLDALVDKFAYNCTNLEIARFNNNLKTIGASSFSGCTALETVSMPGVQTIGASSFSGCTALTGFNVDNNEYSVIPSNTTVNGTAFRGVAIKKLSLSKTAQSKFANNSFYEMTLTDCKIDYSDATSNAAIAKSHIDNLSIALGWSKANVDLPLVDTTCNVDNLSVIGITSPRTLKARLRSYGVQNVYLENIESLSANALSASQTLTKLTLKNSNVPNGFCANCKNLSNVSMSNGTIGQKAFLNCTSLKNLTIAAVTSVGANAFDGCTSLATMSFPTSITEIGIQAFMGCSSLKGEGTNGQVNLSNVKDIGNNSVFQGTAIGQVLFGEQLTTSLDRNTFKNCNNLKKIYFMHRDISNEGRRKLYKILVGSNITSQNSTNIKNKKQITSNICNGTTQSIEVYYNCTGFADTQYKLATITGNKILFEVDIPYKD